MDLLLFGLLSLGSVWYFYRLAGSEKNGTRIAFSSFQVADAIFASLLGLWFLLVIYVSLAQTEEAVINTAVLLNNAAFSFLLILGVIVFLAVRSLNPMEVFGLRKLTWSGVLVSLVALVVAVPVIYFSYAISRHFFGLGSESQPMVEFFNSSQTSVSDRWLLVFTAVVVAPLTEETIFRGYFYGVIRRYGGRWPAILLSAALFAAIHAYLPAFAPLAILAVALTLVYEFTGSLWAPMLMHACFNATTLVISLLWPNLGS